MSLTLIDRLHPRLRQKQQAEIDDGQLSKLEELELLSPEQLHPLAQLSLLLLIIGGIFFIGLDIASYYWHRHTLALNLSFGRVLLWLVINILGYFLILPIHEVIHGLAFQLWGGKPYYGTKWPLALYCGARNQLFRRNQYLVVGIAPFVIITVAGVIFTLLSPVLASYTLFASIGNFSGAAGDLWTVRRLLQNPNAILVEDTESGFRIWELTPSSSNGRMLT